jgi:hypothetical protein
MSNPKTKRELGFYLSNRFISASAWRRVKDKNFPDDPRNLRSAQQLLQMESELEISEAMWLRLKPYYTEDSNRFKDAVTIAMRGLGFRIHPVDSSEWLETLYDILTDEAVAAAAAYTVAA